MNNQGLDGSVEDRIAHITEFNQRYWRLPRPLARILNPQNEINKLLLDLAEAMNARATDSVDREHRALTEMQRTSEGYRSRFDEAEAILRGLVEAVLRNREAAAAQSAEIEGRLSSLGAGLESMRAEIRSEIRAGIREAQQRAEKSSEMLQQQAASLAARLGGLESKVASHESEQLKAGIALREAAEGIKALKGGIEALKTAAEGSSQALRGDIEALKTAADGDVQALRGDIKAVRKAAEGSSQALKGDIEALRIAAEGSLRAVSGNIEALRAGNSAHVKAAEARQAEIERALAETVFNVGSVEAAQNEIKAELAKELEKRPVGFSDEKFYLAFENRFRGSRDEVISKIRDYVPLLTDPEVRGIAGPVLDLGCGRGEWLELVRAGGIDAYGVDVSPPMVEECVGRGLIAVVNDALDHLRSIRSSSLKGITSFHLVEHLGLKALQDILAECFRTLQPGGVLVLETPNPQNLLVGACNFYMDPTHKNPIPPMTLAFLVEYAGFSDVRVLPRNPFPPENHFPPPRSATEEALNSFFFGARDYAVVARHPASGADSSQSR